MEFVNFSRNFISIMMMKIFVSVCEYIVVAFEFHLYHLTFGVVL
jgi:hypothetical protein